MGAPRHRRRRTHLFPWMRVWPDRRGEVQGLRGVFCTLSRWMGGWFTDCVLQACVCTFGVCMYFRRMYVLPAMCTSGVRTLPAYVYSRRMYTSGVRILPAYVRIPPAYVYFWRMYTPGVRMYFRRTYRLHRVERRPIDRWLNSNALYFKRWRLSIVPDTKLRTRSMACPGFPIGKKTDFVFSNNRVRIPQQDLNYEHGRTIHRIAY